MNAVLIDDELNALKSLAWEIETFCNDVTVIGQFSDPLEALKYVEKNTVDIIFLDIEMPGLNGFQFIDLCPAKGMKIIITTAYNQYAIQAIKKRAFDYLLKPIDSDDLKECVEKIKFEINQEKLQVDIEKILLDFTSKTNSNYQRLSFNSESKLFFYDADDILYVKSEGNNSYIYFDKTKKKLINHNLKAVEDKLLNYPFARVHNSFIINLNKLIEFNKSEQYVILDYDVIIPVSRQKKDELLNKL